MVLDEVLRLFLHSRKRGLSGARKACTERTVEGYDWAFGHFFGWLNCRGITTYEVIRRMDVLDFLEWMDEKERSGVWSKATRLKLLRSLRTLFRWVEQDEDCQSEKLRSWAKSLPAIEKTPTRKFIPAAKDIRKFVNSFNTTNRWGFRNYVAQCLMLDTGMRVGEVCSLRMDEAKLEEQTLLARGKTGVRLVPITKDTVRLLKSWLKVRANCLHAKSSPYIFVTKHAPQCTPNSFGQAFRKTRKKHGNLAAITPHTNRHAFCTYYLQRGGNIAKLQAITGHSSFQQLKDYLHLAEVGGKAIQEELEAVSPMKMVIRE